MKWFEAAGSGTAPVATVRGPSTAPSTLPNGPAGSSTGWTAVSDETKEAARAAAAKRYDGPPGLGADLADWEREAFVAGWLAAVAATHPSVTREQVEAAWLASLETDGDSLLATLELLGIEVTP